MGPGILPKYTSCSSKSKASSSEGLVVIFSLEELFQMSSGTSGSKPAGASTQTQVETTSQVETPPPPLLMLNLRGRPQISWAEETVDNEHLGRKSSKRCCIFHKVKKFAESDSDETSDDEKEGDGGAANDERSAGKDGSEPKDGGGKDVPAGKTGKKVIKNYQRHHA